MMYVSVGICLVWYSLTLSKPCLPSSHFPSSSIFYCSTFSKLYPRSEYMDPFSPLPSSKVRPHVVCCSLEMSSSVTCCFQTLGSHNLAESNYSHQLLLWLSGSFREVMADAQSFHSTSIDADCTSSSVCSAPQLIHPEVFLSPHRALLLALT